VFDRMQPLVDLTKPRIVVLACSAVTDIEYTAIKMLVEAEAKLRDDGIEVWLASLNPETLAVVQRSRFGATLGREPMFYNRETAVAKYEELWLSKAPASTLQHGGSTS
jgi:SulP family sulfate permease